MSDETKLTAAVRIGRLLLDSYASDTGHVDVPQLLADLMDLCRRFDTDFEAALEDARDRLRPEDTPGTGSAYWTISISHEVKFSDRVGVYADTKEQVIETAKAHFAPRWSQAELHELTVHEAVNEGTRAEAETRRIGEALAEALAWAGS